MSSRILIVDDSMVDRRLAAGLLTRNQDLRISFAINGVDAISILDQTSDSDRPDVVLTDMVMPEMGGLELVKSIRDKYPQIPVILMTAQGNEAIADQSLRMGAVSYVPKSRQNERLLATIEQVLARCLVEKGQQPLFASAHTINCTFYLDSNPALVRPMVDFAQQALCGVGLTDAAGRIRMAIALEEALLNAIYHGERKPSSSGMPNPSSNIENEEWGQEKQSGQLVKEPKIVVKVNITAFGASFVIRDNGAGFDPVVTSSSDITSRFVQGRYRGLTLLRSLTDELCYNDFGNEVTLRKRRDKPRIRPALPADMFEICPIQEIWLGSGN